MVGLALGSAAVVTMLVGFLFSLFRRRGRRGIDRSKDTTGQDHPKNGLPELEAPTQHAELAAAAKASQEGGPVHELERGENPVIPELGEADGLPPELAGNAGTGGRHELGVKERSIPELEGNNGSRYELSSHQSEVLCTGANKWAFSIPRYEPMIRMNIRGRLEPKKDA